MAQRDQHQHMHQHQHQRQEAAASGHFDISRSGIDPAPGSVAPPPQISVDGAAPASVPPSATATVAAAAAATAIAPSSASANSHLSHFAPFPSNPSSIPSASSSWSNTTQPGFYTNQANTFLTSSSAAAPAFALVNPPSSIAAFDPSSGRGDVDQSATSYPRTTHNDPSSSTHHLEQAGWTSRAPSTFNDVPGPSQHRQPVTATLRKATSTSNASIGGPKIQMGDRPRAPKQPSTSLAQAMTDDDDEIQSSASSSAAVDHAGKGAPVRAQGPANAPTTDDTAALAVAANESATEAAARKQNTACDACRNRKVRCHRIQGEGKCLHCKAKGIDCTTIYVQLASTGAKRPTKRAKQQPGDVEGTTIADDQSLIRYLLLRDADYGNAVSGLSYEPPGSTPPAVSIVMARKPTVMTGAPTTAAESRLSNATARAAFVADLVETYFSIVHIRYPIIDADEFRSRFFNHTPELGGPPPDVLVAVILAWGAKFTENPIIVADRLEAANELTPSQWQKRQASAADVGPASESNKVQRQYGEQRLRAQDLHSSSARNQARIVGRSRIAQDLIVKAQEVLDRNKAHRHATVDNIKAAVIIQALFWQQADASEDDTTTTQISQLRPKPRRGLYICNGIWIMCAISHLIELRIHLKSTLATIQDESAKTQLAMTWWMVCMMDAHMSAFYRRKPHLDFEDYSCDPPEPPTGPQHSGPNPLAASQQYRIWLESSQDQVEMMRYVCETLWRPRAQSEGISAKKLDKLMRLANHWRNKHLAVVGAPSPSWPSHWNFADAVTACSSDFNYYIVWILMWEAIDEYGVYELKQRASMEGAASSSNFPFFGLAVNPHASSAPSIREQLLPGHPGVASSIDPELDIAKVEAMVQTVQEEALFAALRAASLTQVLCDNGYLRLEAGIMKVSMTEAGYCLSRFKRPEITSIIDGLRQYGQAFEECYEQANELERLASAYMSIGPESGFSGGDEAMTEAERHYSAPLAIPGSSTEPGMEFHRNAAGVSSSVSGTGFRPSNAAHAYFDGQGPAQHSQHEMQPHPSYQSMASAPIATSYPPSSSSYFHYAPHQQPNHMSVRNSHEASQRF